MARFFKGVVERYSPFRLFRPDGSVRIRYQGMPRLSVSELYHYLLRASWWRVFFLVAGSFFFSNFLFALAYLQFGGVLGGDGSFASVFFFSVHTMTTLGYGHLYPGSFVANVISVVEVFVGVMGMAIVTGLIFARFSRPVARVLFSKVALINEVFGDKRLLIRVANTRQSRVVQARVHLVLVVLEQLPNGQTMRRFYDLDLVREFTPMFALTWTIMHPINRSSPFYGESLESLQSKAAELVVMFSGLDEAYSRNIYARYSYSMSDLRWNEQFVDILHQHHGKLDIDYTHFHESLPVEG